MTRTAVIFAILVCLAINTPAQQQPYTLSVDIDLVLLNVRVQDKDGRVVSGLTQDSFRIYEDGKPQDIKFFMAEDAPATVGLVIDNSGSMLNKRSEVVEAATAFVERSNPKDEMFIVNFSDRASMGLPGSIPFTNDFEMLKRTLLQIRADGRTAMYDGIAAGLRHLEKGSYQKKALIVLSDGGDNASQARLDDVLKLAQQSSATLYTIGVYDPYDHETNPKVIRNLAKLTGGESFVPNNVKQLGKIWERIAGGIRSQYTLGYVSTNALRDGKFRQVKVSALNPAGKPLQVRTRTGYVAGSPHPNLSLR
jgi:Ca-activated chloride channel family protein